MSLRERIFRSFFQQVPRQVLFGTRLSNHHYRTFQNKKIDVRDFFHLYRHFLFSFISKIDPFYRDTNPLPSLLGFSAFLASHKWRAMWFSVELAKVLMASS